MAAPVLSPYANPPQSLPPMGHLMDAPPDRVPSIPGLGEPLSVNPILAESQQQQRQFQTQGINAQEHAQKLAEDQDRIAAAQEAGNLASDPATAGKPFHELPSEIQHRLWVAHPYTPDIPGLVNSAQSAVTGRPMGAKLLPDETGAAKVGDTSITGIMPKESTQVDPATGEAINEPSKIDSMSAMLAHLELPLSALGRYPPAIKTRIITGAQRLAAQEGHELNFQTYEAQQKARDSFQPGGKNGQSILFNNTVLDHLADVHDLVDSLHNNQQLSALNTPINAWKKNIGGNTSIGRFQTAANTAATEYAKALAGGNQPAEPEIKHFQELLNPNLGPEQLKQNIQQMAILLGGKVRELGNEWNTSVKKPRDIPFLDEGAIKNLTKIGVNPALIDPVSAAKFQQPSATPPPQSSAAPQQDQFQVGKTYTDKSGNRATYQGNGVWK